MNISIDNIAKRLHTTFTDPILCRQYASWILQAITRLSEAELAIQESLMLTQEQQHTLDSWLDQLLVQHKPLQYILGNVPFGDVEILVNPPVLIPRPETEEWCMWLIHKLNFLHNKNITIVDLCTGSGCIAVALAHALPFARVIATDIAEEAIALTQRNAAHNHVSITVLKSDLFDQMPTDVRADIIVANPPYIALHEYHTLEPSVTQWEDQRALVAQDDGLQVIKEIIRQASAWISNNEELVLHEIPQLMVEIGSSQAAAVVALMKAAHYTAITVHKDLAGKDRAVSGRVAYGERTQF